jgi:hypothetical protein
MLPNALSYPLVIMLCAILAGASYLGIDGVFSGEIVAGIYSGILGAVTAGHFALTTPRQIG